MLFRSRRHHSLIISKTRRLILAKRRASVSRTSFKDGRSMGQNWSTAFPSRWRSPVWTKPIVSIMTNSKSNMVSTLRFPRTLFLMIWKNPETMNRSKTHNNVWTYNPAVTAVFSFPNKRSVPLVRVAHSFFMRRYVFSFANMPFYTIYNFYILILCNLQRLHCSTFFYKILQISTFQYDIIKIILLKRR